MSHLPTLPSQSNTGHPLRARLAILGILSLSLLGTNVCRAGAGGVVDNGGFFSEQAKSDAAKTIGEMERSLRKDLAVETFKEIPANLKEGLNPQDKTALGRVCEKWAETRARQKGVNGVYILLVKEPAHLQVLVGNDTQRLAFTLRNRDELVSLMLADLRAHRNDDALRAGVNFVNTTMRAHGGNHARSGTAAMPAAHRQSGGGMSWIIILIVGGLVLWVVIGLIRGLSGGMRGGQVMGQPGYGGGGGGGGFMSSLLGGMLGGAAGMWMYDQFRGNSGNNYGGERNEYGGGGDSGFSGQDTDYSGSGGDFGGDSGGGGFNVESDDSDFGGGGDF